MSEATKAVAAAAAAAAAYLTDTNVSNLQNGQRLIYDGTDWVNKAPIFASVSLSSKLVTGSASPLGGFTTEVANGINVLDGDNLFKITVPGWYSFGLAFNYRGLSSTSPLYKSTLRINLNEFDTHQTLENIAPSSAAGTFGGSFLIELAVNDRVHLAASFEGGLGHVMDGYASLVKVD
jgi:hypothetical protein